MIPDEYIQTFVVECKELLEQMEQALLIILIVEQAAEDPEILNAIFQAVHTIQGSADMSGADPIMVYTDAMESVLDRVCSGDIVMSLELAALFIEAHDHLRELINHIAEGSQPNEQTDDHGKILIEKLESYLSGTAVDQSDNSDEMSIFHHVKGEKSIGERTIWIAERLS